MSVYNDKPLISIIVPVYKAEKYLEECVNSILSQKFMNFELVLIDDCSPDKCPSICEKFAQKDDRVKVTHLEKNGGVVNARDVGLKTTSGVYIAWVDSDDWIGSNRLETIAKEIELNHPDIILTGYTLVTCDGTKEKKVTDSLLPSFYNESEYLKIRNSVLCFDKARDNRRISPNLWAKVWKKELLELTLDIIPKKLSIGDDSPRTYIALFHAKTLSVIDDYSYFYRSNPTQMTACYAKYYFENALWIYQFIEAQCKDIDDELIKKAINENIAHVSAFAICNEMCSGRSKKEILDFFSALVNNSEVRKAVSEETIENQNPYNKMILKSIMIKDLNALYVKAYLYKLWMMSRS